MKDLNIYSINWFKEIYKRIEQLENDLEHQLYHFIKTELITEQEVLDLLQISSRTLSRYCKKGYFKRYRIGNRNMYLLHDVIRGIITHLVH